MGLFNQIFEEHRRCEIVATSTALLISAAVTAASAVGTSYVSKEQNKKTESATEKRHAESLALQKSLASQVSAPTTKKEGKVDLQSVEAQEDEAIRSRSKRSRLKVERSSGAGSVGTGLSVG